VSITIRAVNIFTGKMETLTWILSHEGYLAIAIDIAIMSISGLTYRILVYFAHRTQDLLSNNCFDEYSASKINAFEITLYIVSDKSLEIFVIILCRLTLLILPILFIIISKKSIKFAEFEEIVLEKKKKLHKVISDVRRSTIRRASTDNFKRKLKIKQKVKDSRNTNTNSNMSKQPQIKANKTVKQQENKIKNKIFTGNSFDNDSVSNNKKKF
jgi:hypothetical protein